MLSIKRQQRYYYSEAEEVDKNCEENEIERSAFHKILNYKF